MNKNYYSILGVTDDEKKLKGKEFEKVIKPKFRKLAMEYHPDKQQGKTDSEKKEAEEKFKEISEAYEILSNEDKRNKYDNPMFGSDNSTFDFGGMGFEDIMSHFGDFNFGFGGDTRRNRVKKGSSQRITIRLSLNEVYNGCEKKIRYRRFDRCKECNGKGTTSKSKIETCNHCGGTGTVYRQSGSWQQFSTCPHCNGKGTILKNPCPHCKGNGIVETTNEITISIPKGVDEDNQQVYRGMGNAPLNCDGEYGDLIVYFSIEKSSEYERYGSTLVRTLDINVVDALLGSVVEITTIDGKKISTKIPNGVETGTQLRFSGKGLPILNNEGKYGDMIVSLKLTVPNSLTEKEKELLSELKKCENFK